MGQIIPAHQFPGTRPNEGMLNPPAIPADAYKYEETIPIKWPCQATQHSSLPMQGDQYSNQAMWWVSKQPYQVRRLEKAIWSAIYMVYNCICGFRFKSTALHILFKGKLNSTIVLTVTSTSSHEFTTDCAKCTLCHIAASTLHVNMHLNV